jgi:hypothetical protein
MRLEHFLGGAAHAWVSLCRLREREHGRHALFARPLSMSSSTLSGLTMRGERSAAVSPPEVHASSPADPVRRRRKTNGAVAPRRSMTPSSVLSSIFRK